MADDDGNGPPEESTLDSIISNSSKPKVPKILVVDDEKPLTDMIDLILRGYGCEPIIANDGEQFRKEIQQHGNSIDACILDLLMPGYKIQSALDDIDRFVGKKPAVILSGYGMTDESAEETVIARRYEAEGRFFGKPFNLEKFRDLILPRLCRGNAEMEAWYAKLQESTSEVVVPSLHPNIKRLLIVDTDTPYIQQLKKDLKGIHIDVTSVPTDAIASGGNYDAVIFNLITPKPAEYGGKHIDGVGCVEKIRERHPNLRLLTTSNASFIIPPPDLRTVHIQKSFLMPYSDGLGDRLLDALEAGVSEYDFCNSPELNKAFKQIAAYKEFIMAEAIKDLASMTGISDLETRVKEEEYYIGQGAGARDMGYATRVTAIYLTLLRSLVCRNFEATEGVQNLENQMWNIYNSSVTAGSPIPLHQSFTIGLDQEKRKKAKKSQYLIVLAGSTCSGKTTTALAIEDTLNKLGHPTEFIGNVKTGERRQGEGAERDTYITDKEAERTLKAEKSGESSNYSSYTFLDRQYFSKDSQILDALREGKNVILVRNVAGLKVAGDLLYRHQDIAAKLVSFRLNAPENVLKERLRERELKNQISPEELETRIRSLMRTIDEHSSQANPFDFTVSTTQPVQDVVREIMRGYDSVVGENPHLHYEFSNYARDIIRHITGERAHGRRELEEALKKEGTVEIDALIASTDVTIEIKARRQDALKQEVMNLVDNVKTSTDIEIVGAQDLGNGIYGIYLNPFYSAKCLKSKGDFIDHLVQILGAEPRRCSRVYGLNPVSDYARSKVSYASNGRRIRVDDIAMFSLGSAELSPFSQNELHSVAFVSLERPVLRRSLIEIKGI